VEPDVQPRSPTTRPGGRTARVRQQVLDAVGVILVEQGYDALTIEAVAERSGVHRTTVYRRWRDTGSLLADAIDTARDQAWEPPDTGSLLGDLTEINRQVATGITGLPAALIAASFRSPRAAEALRDFWEDRYARAAVVVERAVRRGEVPATVDARTLLITAGAPLFYELILMRHPAPAGIAERYAAAALGPKTPAALLAERLARAGINDVATVTPVSGGLAALAGTATRGNAPPVFVKTFPEAPAGNAGGDTGDGGAFVAEAEGLAALRDLGGLATPAVIAANHEVLVLSLLESRPSSEAFWERFAHALARLHTTTVHPRFGWHRDNWLGRRQQVNTWTDDGFTFFAEHRLLRWLSEPRVEAALDRADRAALERLCARLPELLPERPACLTHGDLWSQNVLATADGQAALIDPAVSYTWPEVDLAHLWTTAPPPESRPFFDTYPDLANLDDNWRDRMPIIQLRQHLAVLAQFDDDWGAADTIRATLAPHRFKPGRRADGQDRSRR
jgi:fructosamine-3-kinase